MRVDALHEWMVVDRAEALGKGDLLLRGYVLITEEHDEVLPGGANLGEGLLADTPKIDAADLRPRAPANGCTRIQR